MRAVLLVSCVIAVTLSQAFAQSSGPPAPPLFVATVSPAAGDRTLIRELRAQNLTPSAPFVITLLAPDGQESNIVAQADAAGNVDVTLTSPDGFKTDGVYRAVIGLPDGRAASVTFSVGGGKSVLSVQPDVVSPYSALQFLGSGLPADSALILTISLANGRGDRHFFVTTDAAGTATAVVWPQELGETLLEAGLYRASIPAAGVTATFSVSERPTESTVKVDSPVTPGALTPIHLRSYSAERRVWLVYANAQGAMRGEFLVGPTDRQGNVDTAVVFPALAGGQYLLASPYEWGETEFNVIPPTDTPTAIPTPTATNTPTPDLTSTPTPTPRKVKKRCKVAKHHHKRCRPKHHRVSGAFANGRRHLGLTSVGGAQVASSTQSRVARVAPGMTTTTAWRGSHHIGWTKVAWVERDLEPVTRARVSLRACWRNDFCHARRRPE